MPHRSQRTAFDSGWRFLSEVSSVVIAVGDDERHVSFCVDSSPGFVRPVDRNALGIHISKNCALHRAMSQPDHAAGIKLWCRNPMVCQETVCFEGVGSIGPACPGDDKALGAQVCFRMTAFTMTVHREATSKLLSTAEAL